MNETPDLRKASDVAPEFGYTDPRSFIRRWKSLGYAWMQSGRDVLISRKEIAKFIADRTVQHRSTPTRSDEDA